VPDIVWGTLVDVTIGVSVAGIVAVGVNGVGLDDAVAVALAVAVIDAVGVMDAVAVIVTVPLVGVTVAVATLVEVLEGMGLLVGRAVRLGVGDGGGVASCAVAVGVKSTIAALDDGRPDPMKMIRIPAKSKSEILLKNIP